MAMILATISAGARADDERVNLRAELGVEYDSNVHRSRAIGGTNESPVVGSPLGRAVLGWSVADRIGARQDVAFSLLGAAKAFAASEARSENIGVVETSGAWRIAVGDRTRLGVGAIYYEAIQTGTRSEQALNGEARDFRSLTPTLRLQRAVGESGTIALGAGYRAFVYKPNPSYDFDAPVASVEYHLTRETSDGAADWDLLAGGGVEWRRFAGARLRPDPPNCAPGTCMTALDPASGRHQDQFFAGHFAVTRTGRVLVGVGYAIQWNRSNSFSETLLRHVATVRFTTPLPLGFYLAARTELVYVTYADRIVPAGGPTGQPSATIDDENRNHIRAELTRDISARLQLVGRYSLYVNALGQNGDYKRQTATLSIAFTID